MNWKSDYFAKHLAQKGLSAVPGLFHLQEWIKSAIGRWDRFLSEDFLSARSLAKAEQFERARLPIPDQAVEQGTGWHGIDLVFLHLAGTRTIDTFDTRPWLRAELLHRCFQSASSIAESMVCWSAVDAETVRARARDLEAVPAGSLEDLLERIGARFHLTTSFERDGLGRGKCDLFFSDSVLQRVRPGDLVTLIGESRRFLAPNGRHHHVIDCKDFHSITDPRVPELHYLSYTPALWELMTSTYLNYQNRWRMRDFVDLFRGAGCDVSIVESLRTDENRRWLREHAHELHLGCDEPLDDAAITRFELTSGLSPAAAPESSAGRRTGRGSARAGWAASRP